MLTPHFCVTGSHVASLLGADEIDNGIVDLLMEELRPLGLIADQETFERRFVDVVLTIAPDEEECWSRFYRNTLRRLDVLTDEGSVAAFSRIYGHADGLCAQGSILDLGSGFGFFALRRAASSGEVVGCDASSAAVGMASWAARHLGRRATFATADARRLPFADRSFDNVTALHLLEHLDARSSAPLVREAMRVARRRVIVAVPIEDEAESVFGHRQRFDLLALADLGASLGAAGGPWRLDVHERDGGWLVLDRSAPLRAGRSDGRRPRSGRGDGAVG